MSTPDEIFAQMTVQSVAGPPPPPQRRFVGGFPPLTSRVADLPSIEQIDLRMMIEWAIETHKISPFPVIEINCIGHADRDFQRGKAFEQSISERRALSIMNFMRGEIQRLGMDIFASITQPTFIPIFARITFSFDGVGSAQHKPASNEEGRRLNRRVTIEFVRGKSPQPPPPFIVDITKLPPQPPDPRPDPDGRHPWTRPIPKAIKLPKSKLEELLDKVRKSPIKYFDMGSIGKASLAAVREFIDPTLPGPEREKAEEDLAKDLRDFWEEQQRGRDNRLKDPPGDPEPSDQVRPEPN